MTTSRSAAGQPLFVMTSSTTAPASARGSSAGTSWLAWESPNRTTRGAPGSAPYRQDRAGSCSAASSWQPSA
ncbi:hypothetical protein AAIG35_15065 [Cellulosimicrobium funkei]